MINNQQTIADNFSNYFLSIAENINVNNIYSNINCNITDNSSMQFMLQTSMTQYPNTKHNPISSKEIDKIIKSLKSKNAYGCDEISTKLLKISSPFISSPLNYICNKTLSTGVFHDQLRFSEIKPLYKKCNKKQSIQLPTCITFNLIFKRF
jgi:hypothetical protein